MPYSQNVGIKCQLNVSMLLVINSIIIVSGHSCSEDQILIYLVYGVQAITTSTICAHILGYVMSGSTRMTKLIMTRFSNSQSVFLASAVRVAQSLGLHRLGKSKRTSHEAENETKAEVVQRELGRSIWQQLATQDWFSVPFSETYCKGPLFLLEYGVVAFAEILNRRQSTALLYQSTPPVR
jgi:hypothetical protein